MAPAASHQSRAIGDAGVTCSRRVKSFSKKGQSFSGGCALRMSASMAR